MEIAWQDIVGIARTRSFFYLTISDGRHLLVSHASLAGGTADELEQWLREKSGVTKVTRPLDARIFRKAGAAVLALGWIGYDATIAAAGGVQAASVLVGIKALCVLVPGIFVLGSWSAFKYVWNITPQVKAEMAAKKAAQKAAE